MLKKIKTMLKIFGKVKYYQFLSRLKLINSGQVEQLILMNQYRQMVGQNNLPEFQDIGFHNYSQTDEDGFLLYIFSLIGTSNKKVLEMCCGDGIECNAANLIINHGWHGLLFDGDVNSIKIGQKIYNSLKTTRKNPPELVHSWITSENVNELIRSNGFNGEIDLFSLDMDGVDYWIWKSINCIKPRVIVLEYNTYWGADKSVTVPYSPKFEAQIINGAYYCGASLRAFVNLGKLLGYRLVGSNSKQYNAFFIRNDIGIDMLPEIDIERCLPSTNNCKHFLNENNFPMISQLPWETVL